MVSFSCHYLISSCKFKVSTILLMLAFIRTIHFESIQAKSPEELCRRNLISAPPQNMERERIGDEIKNRLHIDSFPYIQTKGVDTLLKIITKNGKANTRFHWGETEKATSLSYLLSIVMMLVTRWVNNLFWVSNPGTENTQPLFHNPQNNALAVWSQLYFWFMLYKKNKQLSIRKATEKSLDETRIQKPKC